MNSKIWLILPSKLTQRILFTFIEQSNITLSPVGQDKRYSIHTVLQMKGDDSQVWFMHWSQGFPSTSIVHVFRVQFNVAANLRREMTLSFCNPETKFSLGRFGATKQNSLAYSRCETNDNTWMRTVCFVVPPIRFRFRSRVFIHQVLQQGKCLESGKHTNIS